MDSIRVLVVDDSPMVYKAVKKAVEPEGFEVVDHAMNGKEGLEKIELLKPDVVILDVTMPIMDGIETATALFGKNPEAKVIMLSAMGDEEITSQAKKIGIKVFLTKPFKPDELVKSIRSIL